MSWYFDEFDTEDMEAMCRRYDAMAKVRALAALRNRVIVLPRIERRREILRRHWRAVFRLSKQKGWEWLLRV